MSIAISDYSHYTSLMRNGFYDKLFFIDKLFYPWNTLLDYGSADGFTTKMLGKIFPDKQIMGYEPDTRLRELALNHGERMMNVGFRDDLNYSADVLYLSSVIHEIYSYENEDEVKRFWQYVFSGQTRRYIVIRDMFRTSNLHSTKHERNAVRKYMYNNNIIGELEVFEEMYGSIEDGNNLVHLLLKLPYHSSPNWKRELYENYVPIHLSDILIMSELKYETVYQERYILPYLRHWWRKELDLDITYPTHGKLILYRE
jgi:hypothetical protein